MSTFDRRKFVKTGLSISSGMMISNSISKNSLKVANAKNNKDKDNLIWANLIQLSYNMWEDRPEPKMEERYYRPFLQFDESLWNDILKKMNEDGMNMVVIDLGDGVQYESHPEIAVKNAWSVKKLKSELAKIRAMDIEPIPKLNFSTAHDAWLGKYSRCVSTDVYYGVCRDLIEEVIDLFDKPRFFHLGMDEETHNHQRYYSVSMVRQFDLWWRDLYFYCDNVAKFGVRPWVWSDYIWHHRDIFLKKMPKNVVQSNWYYRTKFENEKPEHMNRVKTYIDLEEHGYDQIPTGSNWSNSENFGMTVDYCSKKISSEHLLGFLQAPWKVTLEKARQHHMEAIAQVGEAKKAFGKRK